MDRKYSFQDAFDAGVDVFMDAADRALDRDNDDSAGKIISDSMRDVKDRLDD
ncbi:MAG: hypothetical protein ACOCRX_03110 [Candidatus Woesearchaeota archaeon]